MVPLKEHLNSPSVRQAVVDDACRVLENEVSGKSGLGGIAVKAAFKVLKGVKPGFVREVVDALLDEFMDALDPLYQDAERNQTTPTAHFSADSSRVADALLSVTDRRAIQSKRPALRAAYDRLRPTAARHVEAAAPAIGGLVERHVRPSG
jgi:hypothetical protein